MTEFTSSTGVVKDVELDIDRIVAYEAEHPAWSIRDLAAGLQRMRFTDLNLMAQFLGFLDYKQVIDEGFSLKDMGEMVSSSRYLGFTDSTSGEAA